MRCAAAAAQIQRHSGSEEAANYRGKHGNTVRASRTCEQAPELAWQEGLAPQTQLAWMRRHAKNSS
eukprot:COSAG01_NODE_402_length_17510_cov_6.871575_2_plen_66_part_00